MVYLKMPLQLIHLWLNTRSKTDSCGVPHSPRGIVRQAAQQSVELVSLPGLPSLASYP